MTGTYSNLFTGSVFSTNSPCTSTKPSSCRLSIFPGNQENQKISDFFGKNSSKQMTRSAKKTCFRPCALRPCGLTSCLRDVRLGVMFSLEPKYSGAKISGSKNPKQQIKGSLLCKNWDEAPHFLQQLTPPAPKTWTWQH